MSVNTFSIVTGSWQTLTVTLNVVPEGCQVGTVLFLDQEPCRVVSLTEEPEGCLRIGLVPVLPDRTLKTNVRSFKVYDETAGIFLAAEQEAKDLIRGLEPFETRPIEFFVGSELWKTLSVLASDWKKPAFCENPNLRPWDMILVDNLAVGYGPGFCNPLVDHSARNLWAFYPVDNPVVAMTYVDVEDKEGRSHDGAVVIRGKQQFKTKVRQEDWASWMIELVKDNWVDWMKDYPVYLLPERGFSARDLVYAAKEPICLVY